MAAGTMPLSEDEVEDVIRMKLGGQTHKAVANWIGCTVTQVRDTWHASEVYQERTRQRRSVRSHTEDMQTLTREIAREIREGDAPPYKPGDLRW